MAVRSAPVPQPPPPPFLAIWRRRAVVRGLAYLWAGPTSLLGLAAALLSWLSGGRVARRQGLLEAWGGLARHGLRWTPIGARAITLGHVVLGIDETVLEQVRAHELAHVRQAERWGPLFLPAYLAASAWAWVSGRHFYRDNWFERDARRRERSLGQELERRRAARLGGGVEQEKGRGPARSEQAGGA